jgi:hypothetical protein
MKRKIFSTLLMGAFFIASMSMFTSCKDYDDDINSNKDAITALQNQLTTLQAALDQAKTDAATAHATFVTQSDLASKNYATETYATNAAKAAAQEAAATAKTEAIAEAIAQCKTLLAGKASQDDFNALATRVSSIETSLNVLGSLAKVSDVQAADQNLQDQIDALNYLKELLPKGSTVVTDLSAVQQKITELITQIGDAQSAITALQSKEASDIEGVKADIRTQMEAINGKVNGFQSDVNVLQYLVNKILTSISLLPDLYVNGIEAIEFKSLYYVPAKPGTSGNVTEGSAILVDNGEAEATYVLNPSTVKMSSIDSAKIAIKSAIAQTRNDYVTSPIKFNGVSSFANGVMKVRLKKTVTTSLNLPNNNIYIVSLNVPRKADAANKVDAADILSENSRLVETNFTPQIAALPWGASAYPGDKHYSDSTTIYESRVDANVLVTKTIYYKDSYDLSQLVTGCYTRDYANRANSTHNQITKDELKKYGVALRFALPTTPYKKDVDNLTDQQTFASVTRDGVITSKTPAGVTNNEAVVGKEPIIRIDMVDTVNNKLIDQRYMKVKWVLTNKEPIQLDNKTSEAILNCESMDAEYTWKEFVNDIYAKANDEAGLSQSNFEQIYPFSGIVATPGGWTTNYSTTGSWSGSVPVFQNTTNANGDALIATWNLLPQDVQTVYYDSQNNTKTFRVKVTFKSSMPSKYADLWFYWDFTIKLPTLPSINGYYDQYWFNKYDAHDVLPVQYNTKAQTLPYCVYNNNLMNYFTYWVKNGVQTFIVKDLPECGTWDMQFSQNQTLTPFKPDYTGTEPDKLSQNYPVFGAYKLINGTATALQMIWDEGHTSWCGNPAHKTANLFADHKNPANWDLLNPLSDENETSTLGQTQPARTHEKKINMSIWATLNQWNYIPVKKYSLCLVAPLRVNAVLDGAFEDGWVSGTTIDCSNAFTMTDFRGYIVAKTTTGTKEQEKYAAELYKYYEVEDPIWDFTGVRYTMKETSGTVSIDNTLTYANSMTGANLRKLTNGNIDLSISEPTPGKMLFKNNGGSNIEKMCYAYIPCSVTYGFGKITRYVKVPVYPHGTNAAKRNK